MRTLYNLLTDVAIQAGQLPVPSRPSFQRDILPILRSLGDLQWVNKGFAAGFGYGMPPHFLDPTTLSKLANANEAYAELRRTIANSFRDPALQDASMKPWPWLDGDAVDVPMPPISRAMNALTDTHLLLLQCWAEGNFEVDWDPLSVSPASIEAVPLQQQPAMLDRAALKFCLADAFHPGCEMTWPMRHATLYAAPYRLRHRATDNPEPNYGPVLEPLSHRPYRYSSRRLCLRGSLAAWVVWLGPGCSAVSGRRRRRSSFLDNLPVLRLVSACLMAEADRPAAVRRCPGLASVPPSEANANAAASGSTGPEADPSPFPAPPPPEPAPPTPPWLGLDRQGLLEASGGSLIARVFSDDQIQEAERLKRHSLFGVIPCRRPLIPALGGSAGRLMRIPESLLPHARQQGAPVKMAWAFTVA